MFFCWLKNKTSAKKNIFNLQIFLIIFNLQQASRKSRIKSKLKLNKNRWIPVYLLEATQLMTLNPCSFALFLHSNRLQDRVLNQGVHESFLKFTDEGWSMYVTFGFTDGRVVRAYASGAVDSSLILNRVKPVTLKLVFTAFLLCVKH